MGRYTLTINDKDISLKNSGAGAAINAAAAYTVASYFGYDHPGILSGLESFSAPQGRGNTIVYKNITIIDDSYNANPQSVALAIENLNNIQTKAHKYFILGDMLEMGSESQIEHQNIGSLAAASNIDFLFCYGDESKATSISARQNGLGNAIHFESKELLSATLQTAVKSGDIIYIKGSRGMKMETLINDIIKDS